MTQTNEISELIDLNTEHRSKAEFSNQIYRWLRIELKKGLEKANIPYESVDLEKVIKVLFSKFSLLTLDTFTLEIPNILLFNAEEQHQIRDKFQKTIDFAYKVFQKYHQGYSSPQQRYVQAFQDLKNITLLVLEEFLTYGRRRISTPEPVLEQIVALSEKAMEIYWEYQDLNLQDLEKDINSFVDRIIEDKESKRPPFKLFGRDMGIQLLPIISGDQLYDIEFRKIIREIEQQQVRISKKDSTSAFNSPNLGRLVNLVLHRPQILENFLRTEFQKVFPLEIVLKVVEFYENYLSDCSPVAMHLIDYMPIKNRIALFRHLLQNYYYSPFIKLSLAQLRTAVMKENLNLESLEQLIFDPVTSVGNYSGSIDQIQLCPLYRKADSIYINGSILWESFLCYIDSIFKQPAFGEFKGLILELIISSLLYLYDLQPYNIILSNHPTADSNPHYKTLLERNRYPLDPRCKKIYKAPKRVHLKFTDEPFFGTYSFVEFDICFLMGDKLLVIECKNQPVYSRRDRLDITIFDEYRKFVQFNSRIQTYLFEPIVKERLATEGLQYSDIMPIIITPAPFVPSSIQFWQLMFALQEQGYKADENRVNDFNNTIIETFSVDPEVYYYRSPLYEWRMQQYQEKGNRSEDQL